MPFNKEITLSDGMRMPTVGFGTWRIGNEDTCDAVCAAVRAGYRLIDTAYLYENLEGVGNGVRRCGVDRSELWITDKLLPPMMGYESSISACKKDLAASGLDYFDLYLIHWPISDAHKEDWEKYLEDTFGAFIELKRQGLVRSIGVSNFHRRHLAVLEKFSEQPTLNQIESHPGLPNDEEGAYSRSKGIAVQAWRPLMKGGLDYPEIAALANKYGKTPAQICLRYCLDRDFTVLAKSTSPARMAENIDIFDFSLTKEDIDSLAPLSRIGRFGAHPDDAPY